MRTLAALLSLAVTPAVAPDTQDKQGPLVVFLGDSLTAGLGVNADQTFPARIHQTFDREGCSFRLVNAGVSGDTSAGGRSRIEWLLRQDPAVVVVELGGNDALRGQPLEGIEDNLRVIVRTAKAAGARVLLAGMRIPPSYGPEYSEGFAALYPRLARAENLALVPFLLQGVGGDEQLNQADGIHPTPAGHQVIAATVAPYLRSLLGCSSAAPRN
jgi:acyl-CoA thioesterase-1